MNKNRLDLALLERNLASTRTKAQYLIKNSSVLVNGQIITKAGYEVLAEDQIELLEKEYSYVSRGGLKLEAALEHFSIDFLNHTVLDIGQSTGGFTDVLLQNGAKKIVGVDVGEGQLHEKLRENPRVMSFESTDIRNFSSIWQGDSFSRFVVDVSFISMKKIIPDLLKLISTDAMGVALFKPQYEVEIPLKKEGDAQKVDSLLKEFFVFSENQSLRLESFISCPILGADGTQEYLLLLKNYANKK
ncbi:MAG: TlyA family RNA methyltransferase [Oligoflexia bacterium]|nr:TlyA family RNA methyltransferase [Oligoflexia bacterium]